MNPFLTAVWSDLILLSYAVPDEVLTPYLPPGLELALGRVLSEGDSYVACARRFILKILLANPGLFADFGMVYAQVVARRPASLLAARNRA